MAPYDSDSSSDEDAGTQLSYTETNVLLGYADAEDQESGASNNETISKLGGRPDWLTEEPSSSLGRCLACKAVLVLLLQLNGELPDRFPGHERRLYVLACRNRACRRKPGSVRVIRGVRVDSKAAADAAAAEAKAAEEKQKEKAEETEKLKKAAAPSLGNSVFGVANPFAAGGSAGGNVNPFAVGAAAKNPFSIGAALQTPAPAAPAAPAAPPAGKPSQTSTPPAASPPSSTSDAAKDLPKTFAETLSLNIEQPKTPAAGPPPAPEPWPPVNTWPAAYPVSWVAEAEYETLDPTPATIPGVQTEAMEVEDGSASGSGGGGKEDKYVFESNMDAAFQKFADRVAQNPDQVIRYEFAGQPLLYNKDDTVAKVWGAPAGHGGKISVVSSSSSARVPPCPNCRARRVFEVQLMPHAIDLLEANELGLEGMDWGTVVVAVCEKDCLVPGTAAGAASYQEEWVGVQWEELQS